MGQKGKFKYSPSLLTPMRFVGDAGMVLISCTKPVKEEVLKAYDSGTAMTRTAGTRPTSAGPCRWRSLGREVQKDLCLARLNLIPGRTGNEIA